MPIINPGAKVLVTGANGFISAWIVRTLLEQGYTVRGTVRSMEKSAFLCDLFQSHGDRFELVVVEDIIPEGAFDNAVIGMDAIIHTATLVRINVDDPNDLIEPAVNGTVGILKSVLKNAPHVYRIVVLSSIAAIHRTAQEPIVLTEQDWNLESIQQVEQLGCDAPGTSKYGAAKTLAEKAAWAFYNEHRSRVSWDLVVFNPPYVFGPSLVPLRSPEELNLSSKIWYNAVVDPKSSQTSLSEPNKSWVDVRDLSLAIAKSLVVPESGGERFIVKAGSNAWQDWLDTINALSPSPIPSRAQGTEKALPVGQPGMKNAKNLVEHDGSKAQKILSLSFRSMEETARDILADFESRGW